MTSNTTLVESKPAHKSKTLMFNLVAFAAMALPLIQTWANSTVLTVPVWVVEVLALLIPLVNLFLRFMTDQPVSMTKSPGAALVKAPSIRST